MPGENEENHKISE